MLIKKRQSGQPKGALKLRSELGFDSFILPGVGADLVTGAPVVYGSNMALVNGAHGAALHAQSSNSTGAYTISDSSAFLSTTEATVVIAGIRTVSFGGGAFGLGSSLASASANCGAYVPYTDGKIYWDFGGSTEGTSRLSVASLSFSERDVFVFTAGPRGMEIWQNGILRASNSGTATRTTSSNAWGLRSAYDAITNDLFRCYALGYSRKQMRRDKCAELSRDLWGTAFVRRRRGLFASLAAAARRRVVLWG